MRLVRAFRPLQLICDGARSALKTVYWSMVLLLLLVYSPINRERCGVVKLAKEKGLFANHIAFMVAKPGPTMRTTFVNIR